MRSQKWCSHDGIGALIKRRGDMKSSVWSYTEERASEDTLRRRQLPIIRQEAIPQETPNVVTL